MSMQNLQLPTQRDGEGTGLCDPRGCGVPGSAASVFRRLAAKADYSKSEDLGSVLRFFSSKAPSSEIKPKRVTSVSSNSMSFLLLQDT